MIDTEYITIYNTPMAPDRIKSIRERHGLNKSQLARALGSTYLTVHYWETGKFKPSPVFVRMLTQLEQSEPETASKD
jgi:DNA-binding transcriptional regulator YiaG